MTDWTGVRERVLALAAQPDCGKAFGAMGHGFALDEPLTAAELAALEAWAGVELPEDYRSFLLHVGAGGAGPAYGLFPVRRDGSGGWHWLGQDPEELAESELDEPFPGGADPAAAAEILAARPDEQRFDDLADHDAALEAWEEDLAATQYDPRFTPGAVRLCDEGCGIRVWLVVTGSERGRMWRCDEADLHPLRGDDGSPLDFADWYLSWLAAAQAACGLDRTPS